MSQPTNLEATIDDRARLARQHQREMLVRQLLSALDPQDSDTGRDYAGILHRVEEVVAKELTTLEGEASHGTV